MLFRPSTFPRYCRDREIIPNPISLAIVRRVAQ